MSDVMTSTESPQTQRIRARLAVRYRKERNFRRLGLVAVLVGMLALSLLFYSIFSKGYSAFVQTEVLLQVVVDKQAVDPDGTRDPATIARADFSGLIKSALREDFPDARGRKERRQLYRMVSSGAGFQLQDLVRANPDLIGQTVEMWVPADDDIDMLMKGHIDRTLPEDRRRVSDLQLGWLDQWVEQGRVEKRLNRIFFNAGDSREPELAGIRGALMGSLYTMIITLALSFPLGVATAVYLEEFAPRNRWTDFLEVNINNLAAVPSIIFGLLGLAVFLNFFGMPRSVPLVGGLVLTLMTLPTIIIASRAALRSVPPSIREAALGMGASQMQMVGHHVLPLAMPGMLTGTIIGMAQALGETAPLLMIGMVAFIVDIPGGPLDPATVLPVQIYLWADSPERAFVERTSAAIMVLLLFLGLMNAIAIMLRKRFERRW